MSRKSRRDSDFQEYSRLSGINFDKDENMIPMINVIFLLLLYFMVVGELQPDSNITLPISSPTGRTQSYIPTISVDMEGAIQFENRNITLDRLINALSNVATPAKLKIYADSQLDTHIILKIMNASAEIGISQFVLTTQSRIDGG